LSNLVPGPPRRFTSVVVVISRPICKPCSAGALAPTPPPEACAGAGLRLLCTE
jgi:hypothetical protein